LHCFTADLGGRILKEKPRLFFGSGDPPKADRLGLEPVSAAADMSPTSVKYLPTFS
jgi:hypothetical protein